MSATQTHQAAIANLGVEHLLACGLLLGVVVATSAYLRLGLAGRIVLSAVRCAGQLLILCGFILEPLFTRNSPPLVIGYLALIVALASASCAKFKRLSTPPCIGSFPQVPRGERAAQVRLRRRRAPLLLCLLRGRRSVR